MVRRAERRLGLLLQLLLHPRVRGRLLTAVYWALCSARFRSRSYPRLDHVDGTVCSNGRTGRGHDSGSAPSWTAGLETWRKLTAAPPQLHSTHIVAGHLDDTTTTTTQHTHAIPNVANPNSLPLPAAKGSEL
jgi:hypothetical protein